MKYKLLLVISLIVTTNRSPVQAEVSDQELQWAGKVVGVKPPFRIERLAFYEDGGTVGMTVSDANDQELSFCIPSTLGNRSPTLLFIGGLHHKEVAVRSVRLWSEEEKALVFIATRVIDDTICRQDQKLLCRTKSYLQLPDSIDVTMWNVVMMFNHRRDVIRAFSQGDIESLEWSFWYYGLHPPVTLATDSTFVSEDGICVIVEDSKSYRRQLCLKSEQNVEDFMFPERASLTLISNAIKNTIGNDGFRRIVNASSPDDLQAKWENALWELVRLMETKKKIIIEHDRDRDS